MRGIITLLIRKRVATDSWRFKDKWMLCDSIQLMSVKKYYKTYSKYYDGSFFISKDELAFVRLIGSNYGPGDYHILMFGKGKERGWRRFWDGMILSDGKFLRRTEANLLNNPSILNAESQSINTESYVSRYLKPKKPGIWHSY